MEAGNIVSIWPVLVTPLKGGIDKRSLVNLTRWLCGYPIGGLWVLGTGSEDHHLTLAQRIAVADTVCHVATKPVVLGSSFYSLTETFRFLAETAHLGKPYHWTPYHQLASERQLLTQFEKVRDRAQNPVWAYTSANWSQHVDPWKWKSLGAAGLKFSSRNETHIREALELDSDDFPVMTAVAAQTHRCRHLGSKRHTSSIASAVPELSLAAWNSSQGQETLNRLLSAFGPKRDNFVSAAEEKAILIHRGVIASDEVTPGYSSCTDEERAKVIGAYEAVSLETAA